MIRKAMEKKGKGDQSLHRVDLHRKSNFRNTSEKNGICWKFVRATNIKPEFSRVFGGTNDSS